MLLTKEVEIRWSSSNSKHFIEKGYVYTKHNEKFTVKIEDVTRNSAIPINFKCDYCGEIVSRPYQMYLRCIDKCEIKKDCCKKCSSIKIAESNTLKYGVSNTSKVKEHALKLSNRNKTSYENVVKMCEDKDFTILTSEEDYYGKIDKRNKILALCNKHIEQGVFSISVPELKDRKYNCKACSLIGRGLTRRNKLSDVKDYFENVRGYELLSTEYLTNEDKMDFICPKHRDKGVQNITWGHLISGQGCYYCGIERRSGENNNKWQGGITAINSWLRNLLNSWTQDVLRKYDYKCAITGLKGKIHAHHMYSFNKIVKEVLSELNLPVKQIVNEYSDDELNSIENLFMKKHTLDIGICISEDVHKLYHHLYGFDNDVNQFKEFVETQFKSTVINL